MVFFFQKCQFFLYLFLVKTRLEKMFLNILDKKETIFGNKHFIPLKSQKSHIFAKELTQWFCQKMPFFLYLFLVKTRLEIMFHNVLDKKETFFGDKNFIPLKAKKSHIFFKGPGQLTHGFVQKCQFISLFVLGQKKARKNVEKYSREKRNLFLAIKTSFL